MTQSPSRRRAMQAALVTAAALTLPRSPAAAQPATPATSGDATITAAQVQSAVDRLDALIADGMTKTGVPGAAVAVVHNDTVVYEKGFGLRELGRPEAITPDTVFQIASLSKSLSSTLVAALVGAARRPGTPGSGASKLTLPSPILGSAGHHPRHALPSLRLVGL